MTAIVEPVAASRVAPRLVLSAGMAFELVASTIIVADPAGQHRFTEIERWSGAMHALSAADRRTFESMGQHAVMNLLGLAAESPGERGAGDFLGHLAAQPAAEVVAVAAGRYRRVILRDVDGAVVDAAIAGDAPARKRFLAMSWPDVPEWQQSLRFLLGRPPDVVAEAIVGAFQNWHDRVFASEADRLRELQTVALDRLRAESTTWRTDALLRRVAPDVDYTPPSGLETMRFVPVSSVGPVVFILDHRMDTILLFNDAGPGTDDEPPERLVQLGKALADPLRLRALRALSIGPRTLADLATELGVPRTSLAHHMTVLRAAGLITHTTDDGRWGKLTLRPDAVADVEPMFRAFVVANGQRRGDSS